MKGDYSRLSFKRKKHYSAVYKQQGRVDLDSDWNENTEINDHISRTTTRDIIGPTGVPASGDGFLIQLIDPTIHGVIISKDDESVGSADNQDPVLQIAPGTIYVDGILCELEDLLYYHQQPDYPVTDRFHPDPGEKYRIYIDVWKRSITCIEDPEIREIALGGPDSATRLKSLWQVKLSRMGEGSIWPPAVSNASLSTSMIPSIMEDSPCVFPGGGGYQGLENRLYRLEIHQGGDTGIATFKWSRDNASIVIPIEEFIGDTGRSLKISTLGRGDYHSLKVNDVIEVLDDEHDLLGVPGILAKIVKIDQPDNILYLDTDVSVKMDRHPKVRRWDHGGDGRKEIPVRTDRDTKLEHGITIRFSGNDFRTGDHWIFTARTNTREIEILDQAPPRGIHHHFCELGILEISRNDESGNQYSFQDTRPVFPSVTQLTGFHYLGGDGQEGLPGEKLPVPLIVGVSNGAISVRNAEIEFEISCDSGNGSLGSRGNYVRKLSAFTGSDGTAHCYWNLDTGSRIQQVTARLLNRRGESTHPPIIFSANLSTADHVFYDQSRMNTFPDRNIDNVQRAIDEIIQSMPKGGCSVTVGAGGTFDTLEGALERLEDSYLFSLRANNVSVRTGKPDRTLIDAFASVGYAITSNANIREWTEDSYRIDDGHVSYLLRLSREEIEAYLDTTLGDDPVLEKRPIDKHMNNDSGNIMNKECRKLGSRGLDAMDNTLSRKESPKSDDDKEYIGEAPSDKRSHVDEMDTLTGKEPPMAEDVGLINDPRDSLSENQDIIDVYLLINDLSFCLLPGEHVVNTIRVSDNNCIKMVGCGSKASTIQLKNTLEIDSGEIILRDLSIKTSGKEGYLSTLLLTCDKLEVDNCSFERYNQSSNQAEPFITIRPRVVDGYSLVHWSNTTSCAQWIRTDAKDVVDSIKPEKGTLPASSLLLANLDDLMVFYMRGDRKNYKESLLALSEYIVGLDNKTRNDWSRKIMSQNAERILGLGISSQSNINVYSNSRKGQNINSSAEMPYVAALQEFMSMMGRDRITEKDVIRSLDNVISSSMDLVGKTYLDLQSGDPVKKPSFITKILFDPILEFTSGHVEGWIRDSLFNGDLVAMPTGSGTVKKQTKSTQKKKGTGSDTTSLIAAIARNCSLLIKSIRAKDKSMLREALMQLSNAILALDSEIRKAWSRQRPYRAINKLPNATLKSVDSGKSAHYSADFMLGTSRSDVTQRDAMNNFYSMLMRDDLTRDIVVDVLGDVVVANLGRVANFELLNSPLASLDFTNGSVISIIGEEGQYDDQEANEEMAGVIPEPGEGGSLRISGCTFRKLSLFSGPEPGMRYASISLLDNTFLDIGNIFDSEILSSIGNVFNGAKKDNDIVAYVNCNDALFVGNRSNIPGARICTGSAIPSGAKAGNLVKIEACDGVEFPGIGEGLSGPFSEYDSDWDAVAGDVETGDEVIGGRESEEDNKDSGSGSSSGMELHPGTAGRMKGYIDIQAGRSSDTIRSGGKDLRKEADTGEKEIKTGGSCIDISTGKKVAMERKETKDKPGTTPVVSKGTGTKAVDKGIKIAKDTKGKAKSSPPITTKTAPKPVKKDVKELKEKTLARDLTAPEKESVFKAELESTKKKLMKPGKETAIKPEKESVAKSAKKAPTIPAKKKDAKTIPKNEKKNTPLSTGKGVKKPPKAKERKSSKSEPSIKTESTSSSGSQTKKAVKSPDTKVAPKMKATSSKRKKAIPSKAKKVTPAKKPAAKKKKDSTKVKKTSSPDEKKSSTDKKK